MDEGAIALAISGAALMVAILGTYLSNKRARASERIAQEALDDSREGARQVLWSDAIEAVQRIIGFDPTREPVGAKYQDLRVAFAELADGLQGWEGLGNWLAAEHILGAALGRQVLETANPTDSIDRRLAVLDPLMSWGVALTHNLRRLRSAGFDSEVVQRLHNAATSALNVVYAENGWGAPVTSHDRVQPLDQ